MKAKQLSISLIRFLLFACLAITILATSCEKSPSNVSNSPTREPSQSSPPTPTPNKITISAKAKQIEAVILRDGPVKEGELAGLPAEELRILRNVVFARHGMQYERPGLGDYFYNCDWYKPDSARTPDSNISWRGILTANDRRNVNTILWVEKHPPSSPEPLGSAKRTDSANEETGELQRAIQSKKRAIQDEADKACMQLYKFYEVAYDFGGNTDAEQCVLYTRKAILAAEQASGRITFRSDIISVMAQGCRDGGLGYSRSSYPEIELRVCRYGQIGAFTHSMNNALNLVERTLTSAMQRCEVAEERECQRCVLSCMQESLDGMDECDRRWREWQVADEAGLKNCHVAVLQRLASCFARCN